MKQKRLIPNPTAAAAMLGLTSNQRKLLQIVYDAFEQSAEWPRYQYVDLTLFYDHGIKSAEALDALPDGLTNLSNIPIGHAGAEFEVTITIGGVFACEGAESDLALFWRFFEHCVEAERRFRPPPTSTDRPLIKSGDLEAKWGSDRNAFTRLQKILSFEPWSLGQGILSDGTWQATIAPGIREFADAKDMRDYLRVRASFFGRFTNRPVAYAPADLASPPADAHQSLSPTPELVTPQAVVRRRVIVPEGTAARKVGLPFSSILESKR